MRNWAGNQAFRSRRLFEPESVEELAEIVLGSESVRALGTRHSFNLLADTTGDHVSLARLDVPIRLDLEARTTTVGGGQRYGELCTFLETAGFALANLASLPHISIAGSLATASHGSGVRNVNLAAAATAVEIVRADGEIERIDRATPGDALHGAVVSLGALGVVSSVSLEIEPTFRMRQDVYEDLAMAELVDHFEEIVSAAYSVSLFTDWSGASFHQVWLKTVSMPRTKPGRQPASCSGRGQRTTTYIPSEASPPRPARLSWVGRARGTSGSRTSALTTRRAPAPSCRASITSPGPMPWLPSWPSLGCVPASPRWSWSARFGPWQRTSSG